MRIVANYGIRKGSENYSVSLEIPKHNGKDNIEGAIDELFVIAKEAIRRQAGDETKTDEGSKIKNPDLPATKKQKALIVKMAKKKGKFIENLNSLTMGEASRTIEELMNLPDKEESDVLP
jgi:hypothetical protein